MNTVSLERLLSRCADGDNKAFESLYQQVSPRVFGVLLKMVRRRDLAEELLQEAFLRVWRKAGTFNARQGKAATWVVSIARNAAIDLMRRGHHEVPLDDFSSLLDQTEGDTGSPEQSAAQDQSNQRLAICLDELPQQQQQGIRLAFVGGLSHGEVAQCLDRSLGTTKSWIRRGLQALKRCLGQ